jgi:hypothetical protein
MFTRRKVMKIWKGLIPILICWGMIIACGGNTTTPSAVDSADLSTQEQAELVAATLSKDQGGIGKDIENITRPTERQGQAAAQASLSVNAEMRCYDAQGQEQQSYDTQTTDRIEYESLIQGHLSATACFFQELTIDNRSNFSASGLLSGMAIIDGTHSNHSSYVRNATRNSNGVQFSLACDLTVTGVAVDLEAADSIPESGIIEGTMAGSYVRNGTHADVTKQVNFQFTVTYLGDNSAEIELSGDALFTLDLNTGAVADAEEVD